MFYKISKKRNRVMTYDVPIIYKFFLLLVNASDNFSLYAAFLLLSVYLLTYLLFIEAKIVTQY
jgi:hypothetical protein